MLGKLPEPKIVDIMGIKPMYAIHADGRVYSIKNDLFLTPNLTQYGYHRVSLMGEDDKPHKYLVHTLVGLHFIEGYKEDLVIDHKDTNKINNLYTNLEWVTIGENNRRARECGLITLGEDLSYSILTNDQVHQICQGLQDNISYDDIVSGLNVNIEGIKSLITSIKVGSKWKHIADNYNWDRKKKRNSKFEPWFIEEVCRMISLGYGPTKILSEINDHDYNYPQIKKLVWFIKKGSVHQEIYNKYRVSV